MNITVADYRHTEMLWPLRLEFLRHELNLLGEPLTPLVAFNTCHEMTGHLLNPDDYAYLLAIDKDEAVGFMSFWRRHLVGRPSKSTISLTGLYIPEKHRGGTVFRELVKAGTEFVRRGDVQAVQFTALQNNEPMQRLAKRFKVLSTVYEVDVNGFTNKWTKDRQAIHESSG